MKRDEIIVSTYKKHIQQYRQQRLFANQYQNIIRPMYQKSAGTHSCRTRQIGHSLILQVLAYRIP